MVLIQDRSSELNIGKTGKDADVCPNSVSLGLEAYLAASMKKRSRMSTQNPLPSQTVDLCPNRLHKLYSVVISHSNLCLLCI